MKKTAVITFGRMSPPTNGHEKLVNAVVAAARKERGVPHVYVSHSFDKKKNPLKYDDKIRFINTAFGNVVKKSPARTVIEVAKELQGKFSDLVLVVGSDRVAEFEALLNRYNSKEFNFDSIKVVSAGERDPDADDVTGMSASKMRAAAQTGNFEAFKNGLPKKLIPNAKEVYDMTREGMGLHEGLEEDEILIEENIDEDKGVVSLQNRRKRGMKMRAIKARLKMARERQKRRMASTDKLKQRASRKARMAMRKRMSGGKDYSKMSTGQKMAVDKRLSRLSPAVIKRIAQRQLPIVRRAEIARLSNLRSGGSSDNTTTMKKYVNGAKTEALQWDINEAFSTMIAELSTDLKQRYLDKAVDAHRAAFSKPFDREKNAKHVTPTGKIKKSYYDSPEYKKGHNKLNTRRAAIQKVSKELTGKTHYHDVSESFTDFLAEARTSTDGTPSKRYHQMFDADKKPKTDRRFAMFKKKPQQECGCDDEHLKEDGEEISGSREDVKLDKRLKMFRGKPYRKIDPVRKDIGEEIESLAQMTESYLTEVLGIDRDWGTSTLTDQLKAETPGQQTVRTIPNAYPNIQKGAAVWFNLRSIYSKGDAADGRLIQGILVGGDTNKARIRDDAGWVYRVDWEDVRA